MTREEEIERDIRRRIALQRVIESVPCPRCKALPGAACHGDRSRRPGESHLARVDRGVAKANRLHAEVSLLAERASRVARAACHGGPEAAADAREAAYVTTYRREAKARGIAGVYR